MELTDTQKTSVRQWAAEGASLSEIQTRLDSEFSIRMSFMEVRLLVLDLEVSIREKRPPAPPKPEEPETPAHDAADDETENVYDADADDMGDDAYPEDTDADAPKGGGVQVELSRLAQPGFALNGDVTFSDGTKAQWGITSRGELSLSAVDATYRPSPEDVRDFQVKLRALISGQGM